MSTYTQLLYQIVYSTKFREATLIKENRSALFDYMAGVFRNKKCHLYRINGVEDHLHIVTHVHPTVTLSDLVKDVKLAGSGFIKKQGLFRHFSGWQDGYAAFTYSYSAKQDLLQYVHDQEEHHRTKSFREELIELLKEHGVEFDERYLD